MGRGRVILKSRDELDIQLADKKVTIDLTLDAKKLLAERGYDKKMGARPMARVIQEHIKRPLAEELLFGKLADGGHVRVDLNQDADGLILIPESTTRELEHLPEI